MADIKSILRELSETYQGEYTTFPSSTPSRFEPDETDVIRINCPHCKRQFLYNKAIHNSEKSSSVIVCKPLQEIMYNKYRINISYPEHGNYPYHQWWSIPAYQQLHNTIRFMEQLCSAPFTERIVDVKTHGYSSQASIAFLHDELRPTEEEVRATSEYCKKNGIQFYYFARLNDNSSIKTYDRLATAILCGKYGGGYIKTPNNTDIFKAEIINHLKNITGPRKLSAIQFTPDWKMTDYPIIEEKQPINISPKSKKNFEIIKRKNKKS